MVGLLRRLQLWIAHLGDQILGQRAGFERAEYQAHAPERLLGIGQTALRSVAEGVRDLERIRELDLRGVLRVVSVEADAGWVPHWMYRADHAMKRHRNWLGPAGLVGPHRSSRRERV